MACSPDGNKGLPLILQGPITTTILNSIQSSSFIELKPAVRTTFPSYTPNDLIFNESSQTTLRFKATTFALQHIQLFKTVNNSYYSITAPPVAEFALFFKASNSSDAVLLFVPVFQAQKTTVGGNYLVAALTKNTDYKGSVGQLLSEKSIHYETCVPCSGNRSVKVDVLVFQDGVNIDLTAANIVRGLRLKDFGFPSILLPSTDSQTVSVPPSTYDTSTGILRKTYTTLVSTSSDIFTKRFRYYEKTFIQSEADKLKDKKVSTAYKCVPVDTRKNLKKVGDKYVVSLDQDDLGEAQSLQDVVNAQNAATGVSTDTTSEQNDVASYIAIAIGTAIGATLSSGLLWLGFRYIVHR